jgi:DNA-binding NtrC family response regulator
VKKGSFREDLYYRINVIEVKVPPLRDRKDDIPLLAEAFLEEFCAKQKKNIALSGEVMAAFHRHHWPGNVKQLKNVIERAVVLGRGREITLSELPANFLPPRKHAIDQNSPKTLKELEIQAIRETLRKCNGNKSKTARLLGISRKAFYKRLKGN